MATKAKSKSSTSVEGKTRNWIRTVYMYLVCAITIVMVIVAGVQAVRVGLDVYVFQIDKPMYWSDECNGPKSISSDGLVVVERTEVEQAACEKRSLERATEQLTSERKQNISQALAMFLVAFPLYLYHWKVAQRDHKRG